MSKIESENLEGFQVSENTSAKLIEENLGIKFPEIPPVVELNIKNKIQRLKKAGIVGAVAEVVATRRDNVAIYDRRYGAIFTKDGDLFTELHENGHAFLDAINPEIRNTVDEMPYMLTQRASGQTVNTELVEKIVTYRCFDEGIAQWVALETAERLPDDFEPKDIQDLKNVMSQDTSQEVRKATLTLINALKQTGISVTIEGLKAEVELDDPKYATGYFFVNGVIESISPPDDQVGEVLTKLIENPPQSIDELESPQEFALKIE